MWQEKNDSLYREFKFSDFKAAFSFMQQVAGEAERLQHHPRWENTYSTVKIWLNTHDAKDTVTAKDHELAKAIDAIYKKEQMDDVVEIPTTKTTEVKLYTDGGARGNPGPAASGFVILTMGDKVLVEAGIYLGVTTNNQAEYRALKFGLEKAQQMQVERVAVYMDSLLIVSQMTGKFKIKNADLLPIHNAIKLLASTFQSVTYTHVPRELNKLADAMVNKALDDQLKI